MNKELRQLKLPIKFAIQFLTSFLNNHWTNKHNCSVNTLKNSWNWDCPQRTKGPYNSKVELNLYLISIFSLVCVYIWFKKPIANIIIFLIRFSRISADSQFNLSQISAESQPNLSKISVKSQQNLSKIPVESSLITAISQYFRLILNIAPLRGKGALSSNLGCQFVNWQIGHKRGSSNLENQSSQI